MPLRPKIAIPVPTSFDAPYNEQSWPEYARAVEESGGEPVRVALDLTPAKLCSLASECQGILLPGSGADMDPARYGHHVQSETAPADQLRENTDRILLEIVDKDRKPLLAICFGLQSLNVHRGGTLIQHLQPIPVNHRAGRAVITAHSVAIASDSKLGGIIIPELLTDTQTPNLLVNSSHHQAVATPGDSLAIAARSTEDGVIEALEDPSYPWLVGIQWHPERTMQQSSASRAIFTAFLQAAEAST